MMSANVSGKGNLAVNSESISGGVEAEVGAHLLKAGATARGAMKLPFINAMVYGSGGVCRRNAHTELASVETL